MKFLLPAPPLILFILLHLQSLPDDEEIDTPPPSMYEVPADRAESIHTVLATTPIDVAALEKMVTVPPESLRVITPLTCAAAFESLQGDWFVENVSNRPLLIPKEELEVGVYSTPLIPAGGRGCCTFGKWVNAERPWFFPHGWVCLRPGERVPLRCAPPPRDPGDHVFSARLGRGGAALCLRAKRFNIDRVLYSPVEEPPDSVETWVRHCILPDPSTWKAPRSPYSHPILLRHAGQGRFVGSFLLRPKQDRDIPLEMDGFVIDDRNEVKYGGPLTAVEHQTRWLVDPSDEKKEKLQVRTVYLLPESLEPGSYRLLARPRHSRSWYTSPLCGCPAGRAARVAPASDWIPFRVAGETNPIGPGVNGRRAIAARCR